jgi:ribose 5-phosphate isomerase A
MSDQNQADPGERAAEKLAAAHAAVETIPDGAVIGLGSGTTAEIMLQELGARVRAGLHVTGVASSERTATLAASLGIPLTDLDSVEALTLSIDGADEVMLPHLHLVKGRGGALLREKLVAAASRFRIILVDSSKVVTTLATHFPIPVEVVPFGWRHTAGRITALGGQPILRPMAKGPVETPFVTDGGNYVLDCRFGPLEQPEALAEQLKTTVGVVEHGLFIGLTDRVYVGDPERVRIYDRAS